MTERPGILAIWNNVAPGREGEFEEWFQHEHLEERIAVPGLLLGRRHEAVSGTPRFFNFYVVQSADVLKSAAYLARLDDPTPMTRRIMSEVFRDMIRTACHRTLRLGAMRGTAVVTARFNTRPDEGELKRVIETLLRQGRGLRRNLERCDPTRVSGVRRGATARRRRQDRDVSDRRYAARG